MSIDTLQAKIRKLKNPTMVCLCPSYDDLPPFLREQAAGAYGPTLKAAAEACREFCFGILDALSGVVPAVSVETGCFWPMGAEGIAVMQQVLAYAGKLGYYVLLDMMRADVAHVAQLQADACFGQLQLGQAAFTPYPCDGVLLSAYLGTDALKPFTGYCKDGKNVFLLARSSNKSAREVQDLISGDRVVHQVVTDLAMRLATEPFGRNGYAEVGVSVGATNVQVLRQLREKYDRLFFLVSGYGAQGGGAKDVQHAFDKLGHGAAILAGRSILYAYQKQQTDGTDYQQQAADAARRMKEQILGYITVI